MQLFPTASSYGGLLRALAISLVFHILLLWPAALVWQEATPTMPLVASLRPSSAPVAPAGVPAILPKSTPMETKEHGVKLKPAESFAPVPRKTELDATDPSPSTAAATNGSEAAAQVERPVIASALPPRNGVDADGLRSYRLALARETRRYKRYPARAIEAGWEGTAELRIEVAGNAAPTVHLTKSSGHRALDEAALEMLRHALPVTPVPAPLQAREFSVDLPIVFELPQ